MQSRRVTIEEAFTLIELLVVIAIIVIMLAILLPSLVAARASAIRIREVAGAQQLMVAYHAYAADHGGAVLPGYIPPFQIRDPNRSHPREFEFRDESGRLLHPDTAARAPWRIAPYLDEFDMRGLHVHERIYLGYMAKDDAPDVADATSRQYALSYSPTFGINALNIGGDWKRSISMAIRPHVVFAHEVHRPDWLLVFASARYFDVDSPSVVVGGRDTRTMAPGYYEIQAPTSYWSASLPYDEENVGWDANRDPTDFGYLDLRHHRKAVIACFDGHAELLGLMAGSREGLRDMRRWSNAADTPEGTPPSN